MDKDFRGLIRFKDFLRFCKNHEKGRAYETVDSSCSESEIFDMAMKECWKEIDPERICKVPY